jgi:hypothetical protein
MRFVQGNSARLRKGFRFVYTVLFIAGISFSSPVEIIFSARV